MFLYLLISKLKMDETFGINYDSLANKVTNEKIKTKLKLLNSVDYGIYFNKK